MELTLRVLADLGGPGGELRCVPGAITRVDGACGFQHVPDAHIAVRAVPVMAAVLAATGGPPSLMAARQAMLNNCTNEIAEAVFASQLSRAITLARASEATARPLKKKTRTSE